MTNVLNVSLRVTKRALTVGVVLATIAWSVAASLVIAPRAAHAAVNSGDLVKGSLSAVYYIGSDGKRYVFTSDKSYKTWYADFSTVKTISDSELASVMIGGNVTYRPGARMVKIQSDSKTYAIGHGGVLRWVKTEAAATALYGSDWNKKIDDISDAFFVNYTVGSDINSASDFNVSTEQSQSGSINADKGLSGSGAINISLAPDTAPAATVTKNAQSVNLLKVNVSGAGTITSMAFHRGGPGVSADWANIYLYDGDTRLTNGRSISSATNDVVFSNLNLAIGGTKSLTLVGDLATSGVTVADAHNFSLQAATAVVASATIGGAFPLVGNTVTISGSSSGTVTIEAASAPSNPKVGQAAAQLANFKLTAGGTEDIAIRRIVLTQSGSAQASNLPNMRLMTGSTVVAQSPVVSNNMITFILAVPYVLTKGTNRTFNVVADIGAANRPNTDTIKLYVDQTYDLYATGSTYGVGVAVTDSFASSQATTLTIEGGQLTVAFNGPTTGDVARGGNDISVLKFSMTSANNIEIRNLRLRLTCTGAGSNNCLDDGDTAVSSNQIADLKIVNADSGAVLAGPVDIGSWTDAGSDIRTKTYTDRFTISAGQTLNLALTMDVLSSASSDIVGAAFVAQLDARVAGDVRNTDSNQDVALSDMVPSAAISGNAQTVRASGLTIGVASSPTSVTTVKGSTVTALGINFTAGTSSDVKVTQIKLHSMINVASGTTYGVTSVDSGTVTRSVADVVQSLTIWDGATQLGTAKTPDSSGDTNFTSLGWVIPAGTTKTVTVKGVLSNNLPFGSNANKLIVDLIGDGTAATTTANVVAEDKDANTVSPTNSGFSASNIHLNKSGGTGGTSSTAYTVAEGAAAVIVTAQGSGTVQIKLDGDTAVQGIVTSNTNDNSVTKVRFTSLNENFLVTRMTVQNGNSTASRSITSVRLYDKNGTLFCSGALDTNNRLRCSNDSGLLTVAGDHTITIKVNIDQEGTGTTGANSGDVPRMGLYINETDTTYTDDIKLVGVSSGGALLDTNVVDQGESGFSTASLQLFDDTTSTDDTTVLVSGNAQVVRKTQPTIATVAASTTLISGENTAYKFSVSAASNADVIMKRVTLTGSHASLTSIGFYKFLRNGTDISDQVSITDAPVAGVAALTNLKTSVNTAASFKVLITFNTEETVAAGTTKTFEVRATVAGAAAGRSMSHFIADDSIQGGNNTAASSATSASNSTQTAAMTSTVFGAARSAPICVNYEGTGAADVVFLDTNMDGTNTTADVLLQNGADTGETGTEAAGVICYSSLPVIVTYDGSTAVDNVFLDVSGNGTYDAADDVLLGTAVDQTLNDGGAATLIYAGADIKVNYTGSSGADTAFLDVDGSGTFTAAADVIVSNDIDQTNGDGFANVANQSAWTNFLWSDNSADGHTLGSGFTSATVGTSDYTNGYNVNALSTSPQSLSL